MNAHPVVEDERSEAGAEELEIPSPFRRAFEPTLRHRAVDLAGTLQRSVGRWIDRQRERPWLPREVDPVTELKHVWLGEYGLAPDRYGPPSPRRTRPAI